MKREALLFALLLLLIQPVVAEERVTINEADVKKINTAITDKDYLEAVNAGWNACMKYRQAALEASRSLAERARQAKLYADCVKMVRGHVAVGIAGGSAIARDLFETAVSDSESIKAKAESEHQFMGLNLGVGLGFSRSSSDAVDSAQIINNVVVVTSEKKQQARVFLEAHYFIEGWCYSAREAVTIRRGCGPFVAIASSSKDVLSGVGFGWMLGFKPKDETKEGFSFGIGAMLDNNVKDLADGFREGEAPPPGASTVSLQEKSRWSTIFFATRTF